MSDNAFEPITINTLIQNMVAVSDDSGVTKFANDQVSSFNFNGLIPRLTKNILVSEIKPGMKFIPNSQTGELYSVVNVITDDPLFISTPSNECIIVYKNTNNDIEEIKLNLDDEVTVQYEGWDDKILGTTGWVLTSEGNTIFSNAAIRGRVEALEGDIGGWQIINKTASQAGALYFNGNIGPGKAESGVYLSGIYTAFGPHTASWQEQADIHQPSKIFIVYGPGLDSTDPENLIPKWNDPNTIFYADGHGYFSLGDRLIFDANSSTLQANSAIFSGSLVSTNFYSGSITGGLITGASVAGNNIYGASVIGGFIQGINIIASNIKSSDSITSSSGNGIYLDGDGNVRFSGPGGTLTFSPEDGLYLEGYASSSVTDAQVISLYSNIRTASTVLGAKILTASTTLNSAVVTASSRLNFNILSASNSLTNQVRNKISIGGAAEDILNNGKSITAYNVQTGELSTTEYLFIEGNFSASGISINLNNKGYLKSPNFSINENQLIHILNPSIYNPTINLGLINNSYINSSSIVGGIIGNTTTILGSVNKATYANNLDSTINGGATIYGTQVLIDSISSAAGTALVRSSTDNTLKLSSSSRRYKENIFEINTGSDWINSASLSIKSFNYIGDTITQIGLIAEDVASIPEINKIVNFNMDGEAESIQYDRFGLLLIPIVKELIEKVETLQNRVIQLESKLGG